LFPPNQLMESRKVFINAKNADFPIPELKIGRFPVNIEITASYKELKELIKQIHLSKYLMYTCGFFVNVGSAFEGMGTASKVLKAYNENTFFEDAKCEVLVQFVSSLDESPQSLIQKKRQTKK